MSSLVSREAFLVLQLKAPVWNKLRTKIPGAELGLKQRAIANTYFYIGNILQFYIVCCILLYN